MEIISPSGRVYQWDKQEPPTEADIEALQKYDASLGKNESAYAETLAAQPGAMQQPKPTALERINEWNPMSLQFAMSNKPAMLLNMAKQAGLEGGGAAGGQALGAMTGPVAPVAVPVLGAIGGAGGNLIAQATDDRPGIQVGEVLAAGATGAIPGASLAGAGAKRIAIEGLKQGLGSVGAVNLQSLIDREEFAGAGENAMAFGLPMVAAPVQKLTAGNVRQIQKTLKQQAVGAARDAGYIIPPSKLDPSAINNTLESIAGKAATAQEAAIRNQAITNSLAKKALGLPVEDEITLGALNQVRNEAAEPYRKIAALNADSLADLEALKNARFESTAYFKHYDNSADPSSLKKAKAAAELAEEIETKLEKTAVALGQPQLVGELRSARTRIAKSYDVERALNLSTGDVSAGVIGRAYDKGKPLSGELETIARFQQAFPGLARDGVAVPSPGVSKLKPFSSMIAGGLGYGAAGPAGLVAAALPFTDTPARELILSGVYQNMSANRFINPPMPQGVPESFMRLAAQSAGRQGNRFLDEKR